MIIRFNGFLLLFAAMSHRFIASATDYVCTDHFKGYCVIENVTAEDFPESTFPGEKSLLIQNSTIESFREEHFRRLPAVENLMIHHLKIEQLQLEGCDQLLTLFASYNHISNLSVAAGLPLRSLHLYQNLLTDVSALGVLRELEQLYLNDNLIETLNFDVFAGMKSLKILTLHRNQITAIDTPDPIHLPSLESLFLQHNKLTYLDTGLWRMPALHKLDLSGNELGFLFTFLEEFPALSTLELHSNKWNCAWLHKMIERMQVRAIQHTQADQSCEGTLFEKICCLPEGAEPDPMMLLISRTGIVDDLNDQLEAQRKKVEQLEESQRKQTYKLDEMKAKVERLGEICERNEL